MGPLRESEDEGVAVDASNYVEDDSDGDDEDEDDAPPAPARTPPAGFTIASSPTFSPAALIPKSPEQENSWLAGPSSTTGRRSAGASASSRRRIATAVEQS